MGDCWLESLILFSLMASGQALLPPRSNGEESTRKSNSAGIPSSPSDSFSTSSTSWRTFRTCVYISPDLPACDFEKTAEAEESSDSTLDPARFRRSVAHFVKTRTSDFIKTEVDRKRSVDDGTRRRVTVYSIEGCVPPRLPFNLPPCKDEDFVDEVELHRLYPFTLRSVTEAPDVLPEFDRDRRVRGLKRSQDGTLANDSRKESSIKTLSSGHGENERKISRKKIRRFVAKGSSSKGFVIRSNCVTMSCESARRKRRRERASEDADDRVVLLEFRLLSGGAIHTMLYEAEPNEDGGRRTEYRILLPSDEKTFDASTSENVVPGFSPLDDGANDVADSRKIRGRKRREIKVGSEFPYLKAIPFDPKKLTGRLNKFLRGEGLSNSRKSRETDGKAGRRSSSHREASLYDFTTFGEGGMRRPRKRGVSEKRRRSLPGEKYSWHGYLDTDKAGIANEKTFKFISVEKSGDKSPSGTLHDKWEKTYTKKFPGKVGTAEGSGAVSSKYTYKNSAGGKRAKHAKTVLRDKGSKRQ